MFRDLIDKLKSKKKQLKNSNVNDNTNNKSMDEESNFEITISNENNIYKIEISDFINISDYIKKMRSSKEYCVLNLICNSVLWNTEKQKVNKGIYYVITIKDCIYNILFTDEIVRIDERTKIEIDEQTQKENVTQEKVITFNVKKNEYHYFSAKHDKIGDTFYTRYYDKNKLYSFGKLDLSAEETYEEISLVIHNLESIDGIENVLDIELLKEHILKDLNNDYSTKNIL